MSELLAAADAASVLSSKRVVYVGGLPKDVNAQTVRAAFIPFGTIQSVDLPMDYETGKPKGFGFIEFRDPDDAAEAIYNLDGSMFGGGSSGAHTIRASLAQANQVRKLQTKEAVWKSDEWFQGVQSTGDVETEEQKQDGATLQEA